jgi:type III restriction enzyme
LKQLDGRLRPDDVRVCCPAGRASFPIVDDNLDVHWWVRLQTGEVPILWRSGGRNYNVDMIVVENAGTHWVVEIESDKETTSEEVQDKPVAARRWVNHVNASPVVTPTWQYLLVNETDIRQAKGSWSALKKLGD